MSDRCPLGYLLGIVAVLTCKPYTICDCNWCYWNEKSKSCDCNLFYRYDNLDFPLLNPGCGFYPPEWSNLEGVVYLKDASDEK